MTDDLETPPREPGTVRRSRVALEPEPTAKLAVECKLCKHATHYAACTVRLPWYWRFFLRREFCCCTAT